jgi:hypothetical protein
VQRDREAFPELEVDAYFRLKITPHTHMNVMRLKPSIERLATCFLRSKPQNFARKGSFFLRPHQQHTFKIAPMLKLLFDGGCFMLGKKLW